MSETTKATIKPGDIWRSVWGHEQTNVDFYEVTRATETTVTLARLEQFRLDDGRMGGRTKPIAGRRAGERPIRRKLRWYEGEPFVMLESYSMAPTARPYDGTVMRYTTYA